MLHKYIRDLYFQKSDWEEDWCMLWPDSGGKIKQDREYEALSIYWIKIRD